MCGWSTRVVFAIRPGLSLVLVAGIVIGAGLWAARLAARPQEVLPFVEATNRIEAAPMCPWRNPREDLRSFFPKATDYRTETRILSGQRLELARLLGRPLLPEENALHLYRVEAADGARGTVMVRRVKGTCGAIEIVVAVDSAGLVRGVRVQRHREPSDVAARITDPAWLAAFRAMGPASDWRARGATAEPARQSAAAIVDGVRSLVLSLELAERSGLRKDHH